MLALPTLLLSVDIFVLLLALLKIDVALRPSSTQQLWITDSSPDAAPAARAGAAAALNETGSQLGFALGIAVLGSVAAAVYRSRVAAVILPHLPSWTAEEARDTLAGATAAAQAVPHQAGAALLHAARAGFTAGMDAVAVISALLLTDVALGVLVLLRHVARSGPEHPSEHAGDLAEHSPVALSSCGVASPSRVSLGQAEADQEGLYD